MKSVLKSGAALAAVCAAVFFPTLARADVGTIVDSNSAIWGSVGVQSLNYKESVTPIPDSQHGVLPSFAGGVDYMTNGGLYLAGQAALALGGDGYNGALQDGPGNETPYQGKTHEVIVSLDGKIGQGFGLGPIVMATPYFDLGFRYWKRNLGDGFIEEYHHVESLAGAMLQVSPTKRLVLTGYGAVGVTFGSHMRDDLGTSFPLGPAGIYKIGGKIGYDLTQRWEVFTSLDFDHFRYVNSTWKSEDGGLAMEPSSFTNETAMRLGLAYHLK